MTEKNDRDVHLCAQHKHRVSLLRSAFCAGLSQTQGKATARLQSACSARYAAWQVCDAHHQHWPVPACHRCVAHLLSTVRRQAEGRSANELQSACSGRYAARQVCDARHKRWPVPAVTPTTHALTKQHFFCGSCLLILWVSLLLLDFGEKNKLTQKAGRPCSIPPQSMQGLLSHTFPTLVLLHWVGIILTLQSSHIMQEMEVLRSLRTLKAVVQIH